MISTKALSPHGATGWSCRGPEDTTRCDEHCSGTDPPELVLYGRGTFSDTGEQNTRDHFSFVALDQWGDGFWQSESESIDEHRV